MDSNFDKTTHVEKEATTFSQEGEGVSNARKVLYLTHGLPDETQSTSNSNQRIAVT